jgi:hypothetical protein
VEGTRRLVRLPHPATANARKAAPQRAVWILEADVDLEAILLPFYPF